LFDIPEVIITKEMVDEAKALIEKVRVYRTQASEIDTLTGILGEFIFAQYFYNDWRKNRVGANKGEVNFYDVEIKTSAFPYNNKLHLLVREDYAEKRKPAFYIQIIISVESSKANNILPGTRAYICGFATSEELDSAPLKDFGSKYGQKGGYKCHYIPITKLNPMDEFRRRYSG
jgi:hypothetical protein